MTHMRRFEVSLLRCAVTPPALVEILGVDLLTSAFGTLTFVRGVAALIGWWWLWWLWYYEAVLVGNIFQFLLIVVMPLKMSKWDKMYTKFFIQALLLLGSLLTPREVERSLSTSHLCHKHNHFHNWLKQWYQHQVAFYISTTLLAISAVICLTAWLVSVYFVNRHHHHNCLPQHHHHHTCYQNHQAHQYNDSHLICLTFTTSGLPRKSWVAVDRKEELKWRRSPEAGDLHMSFFFTSFIVNNLLYSKVNKILTNQICLNS